MREPEVRKAKRVWGPKRNGVGSPFRFRRGLSGLQAFVFLGLGANRNETGIFRGVTGKPSRLAPPNTVTNRRDPFNFNGLRGMAFAAETVFLENGHRLRCFKPPMSRTKTGRDVFPTHSPHHAFQVARICCKCREEKCCKPLDSLVIQSIRDLGQRRLPPPPRSCTSVIKSQKSLQ